MRTLGSGGLMNLTSRIHIPRRPPEIKLNSSVVIPRMFNYFPFLVLSLSFVLLSGSCIWVNDYFAIPFHISLQHPTNLQCSITSYDSDVFKKQSMAVSSPLEGEANLIKAASSTSALPRVGWERIIRYVTQNLAVFIHEQRKRKIWEKKVTNGKWKWRGASE